MYKKYKKKNKIYQSYDDFYNKDDLKDPEMPQIINLTIDDFDARGEIANPRAPCVVTTIDPEYIKDASLQRRTRKFRVKTDILTLREITRKKFLIYATQQRYLEKQREASYHEQIYQHISESQKFADTALCKSESVAFTEMKKTQQQLENLQKDNLSEELQKESAEHHRVLMEVQDIYGRFLFLLKLIGYFDEIIAPEDIDRIKATEECKVPQLTDITCLQINEQIQIGENDISAIISYMNTTVRPYLANINHLNADIWIKGYERTRQKMFNYNRRFNHLALLNHIVTIILGKSEKTFIQSLKTQEFLKDNQFDKLRIDFLNQRSLEIIHNFERKQKNDIIQIKLNAILPVILENIESKLSQNNENIANQLPANNKLLKASLKNRSSVKPLPDSIILYKNNDFSTLEKVEKVQWHLTCLLQNLEKIIPDQCIKIEKQVRKRVQAQKEVSRRVLVKRNRLQNWMEHFIKHAQHN